MFIIWGFGKQTRKVIGNVFYRKCAYCNTEQIWQLCLVRTWFTLFFIPVIPYGVEYQISCPNCKSYQKLTKEQFNEIKAKITSEAGKQAPVQEEKYAGKTETQINYMKEMEKAERGE